MTEDFAAPSQTPPRPLDPHPPAACDSHSPADCPEDSPSASSDRFAADPGATAETAAAELADSEPADSQTAIDLAREATQHVPVLPAEIVEALQPRPGAVLVDGTLGGGGHTRLLAPLVEPGGRILALDRDPSAVARTAPTLAGLSVETIVSNYADLPERLEELGVACVDGVVLDLGLSSDQLADRERGFSFDSPGPLDLRFDPTIGQPTWQWVNRLREEALADLIYEFGEERHSRRIARALVAARRDRPLETAAQFAAVVRRATPKNPRDRIDPATRTFQALRIAANEELRWLSEALRRLPDCLAPNGRLAIISFHSLEDRLVKHAFRDDPRLEPLTRKPIEAGEAEQARNPRSRSAKLRVARRKTAEEAAG